MKTKFIIFLSFCCALIAVYLVQQQQQQTTELQNSEAAILKLNAEITKCGTSIFQLTGFDSSKQVAPMFDNLGNHNFAITTSNDMAQSFFDQGLKLAYAFNHAEAHRSFMEVARLDPNAAMAYWGQAYALGPNINDPFPDENRQKEATRAVRKAKALAGNVTDKERMLIEALTFRYAPEANIEEGNRSYMIAMEEVVNKFPEDAEVQTLFAEAVMNTMPWNYWKKDGTPNENTLSAKEALEKAIALSPDHPGAHHYYIHLLELPKPELAISSAEKLGTLMPGAGHLVHMPCHIFIRVGRYADAVQANINAIAADEDYISQCYSQGLYPLAYYPHNIHFLWSAASLMGDSKTAIEAARKTTEKVPASDSALIDLPFLQDYASTPILAYVRFGKWNDILTIPYPGKDLKHLALIWHYGRGMAFVRNNNLKEAAEELEAIESLKEDPELENIVANYTNPSSKIAAVAFEVVAGEINAAKGDFDKAIVHLKRGVQYEDELTYSEPAPWHIPVRQTLGAVLLKAGRAADAAAVYRENLTVVRENGWALRGLYNSLKAQGKDKEAADVEERFNTAWAGADIQLTASVL